MQNRDTMIAVLPDHAAAEAAIKRRAQAGFDMKSMTVIGDNKGTEPALAIHSCSHSVGLSDGGPAQ